MKNLRSALRIILAGFIVVSNPCMAGTSELDNERQIANSRPRSAGLPKTIIVRENKWDGTLSVAVDEAGACGGAGCEVAKIQNMKFQNVNMGELYSMDGVTPDAANNELDRDNGAGRESWFWAVLLVGAAIGVAWHNSKHSHHKTYYSYNPYWGYNYDRYDYWAYGCGRCGYGRGYVPYYRY